MTTYKEALEILNPQHRNKNLYIRKESLSMPQLTLKQNMPRICEKSTSVTLEDEINEFLATIRQEQ